MRNIFEPITKREIFKQGIYGTFPGDVKLYVNKRVPAGHIQVFLGPGDPKDVNDQEWSDPVPIELVDGKDTLSRILKLKVFW